MNSRPTKKPDAPRGPFRELRRAISRILGSRAFLMALSLLTAVVFWSILVASDGTLTREKTFQNVAVSVTGESTLKSRGYIVMDDLDSLISGVKLTVEVTQSNYSRVSGTSYNPHIDLTQVTGEGENVLNVAFSSQLYGPVVSCEPSSVRVNVERYITRRVPVVLETSGGLPGYYLDSAKTDPTMLSVSGPQSLVSQVARAVASIDVSLLSGERRSDRNSVQIRLQDAAGNTVESDLIEITNQTVLTDTVVVETELVPMREVPLEVESLVTGEPAEGYELLEVTASQESLLIAAADEVLDAITVLTTDQPLSIEGATQDVTGTVRLRRPTGIENTVPYDVTVTARIGETTAQRTLRQVQVEVDGLDDSLRASLSREKQTVQLTGPYTFINGLSQSDVRLFVDVNGLGEGTHVVPVQISIDNAPEFACALSSPEITVTIRAR
ncbi:MAG: YbbR-like domain-containing protein [Candidatus Ventricola sp.]